MGPLWEITLRYMALFTLYNFVYWSFVHTYILFCSLFPWCCCRSHFVSNDRVVICLRKSYSDCYSKGFYFQTLVCGRYSRYGFFVHYRFMSNDSIWPRCQIKRTKTTKQPRFACVLTVTSFCLCTNSNIDVYNLHGCYSRLKIKLSARHCWCQEWALLLADCYMQ